MDEEPVALTLSVSNWQFIDGTMDNVGAIAIIDAPETADIANFVRNEGWDQIVGAEPDRRDWPEESKLVTVALTSTVWEFIVAAIEEGTPLSRKLAVATLSTPQQRLEQEVSLHYGIQLALKLRELLSDLYC
ncbi:hypothetical protein [Salinibacterium sp.]|uniref:hypothetical protein n=1 Tax=Salinibacterium sp. TaxID=1915057 RepID=UPI00286CCF54|nr:hypothetical protein [Salinibacterium sp.]